MDDTTIDRFADQLVTFLEHANGLRRRRVNPLTKAMKDHLGDLDDDRSSLQLILDNSERPNLQLALDQIQSEAGTASTVIGLPDEVLNHSGFGLNQVYDGLFHGWILPSSPQHVEVPIDPEETLPCLVAGVVLTMFDGDPVAILMAPNDRRGDLRVQLEAFAASESITHSVLDRIKELMNELNVYRGKTLAFTFSEYGRFGLDFVSVPTVPRDHVILPAEDLAIIERQVIGISERATELLEAGQHLKRGLLLYGPPGTGKTHTLMYLLGRLPDHTVIMLSGPSVQAIGQAGTMARRLSPAMIVIEDVDLIAEDRHRGHQTPLLFQLLNDMDGLSDDSDVVFVLTTNLIEVLEPALVARPGRVDQAVELGLPGPDLLRSLIGVYLGHDLSDSFTEDLIERLGGTTGAFIKELGRRATMLMGADGDGETAVDLALAEMTEHAPPILRRSLGVE